MIFPTIGTVLHGPDGPGTLRLVEFKGGGSFGVVYRAVDSSDASYTVKFPQVTGVSDEAELRAFYNEVRASAEIRHPNVVAVLHVNVGATEFPPYIVMEYVGGGTLKSCLDKLRAEGEMVDAAHVKAWAEALIDAIAAVTRRCCTGT